jgi:hypothetical protein
MYLACSKSLQNKTSLYLHLMQEKSVNIKALNPENGRKLWEASEKLITNY